MNRFYWYWLSNIPGIGAAKIRSLLEVFGAPEAVYKASEARLREVKKITAADCSAIAQSTKNPDIYRDYLKLQTGDIRFVIPEDENYPARLRNIYDAPVCLYYRGDLPRNDSPAAAIVGSRSCSEYGRNLAEQIGSLLAGAGVSVVSGMAAGIDCAGHKGALLAQGKTYAVLGCGVDVCYPACAGKIYHEIMKDGGVISEYPPQTEPLPGRFPMRNRIISGLSDLVIVVEARKKSGSLITVDQALEQNREVMAVPGRVGDKLSEGSNALIQMGAAILTKPEDALDMLKVLRPDFAEKTKKKNFCLAPEEEMVYSGLDFNPRGFEEILERCKMNPAKLSEILMKMIIKGAVRETAFGFYAKI